jgi:hypothetical protein
LKQVNIDIDLFITELKPLKQVRIDSGDNYFFMRILQILYCIITLVTLS